MGTELETTQRLSGMFGSLSSQLGVIRTIFIGLGVFCFGMGWIIEARTERRQLVWLGFMCLAMIGVITLALAQHR